MVLFTTAACSPKISTYFHQSYPPLPPDEEVVVLQPTDVIPEKSTLIGEVKIKDSGLTIDCGYDLVLNLAKDKARQAGGNLLKITLHLPPDLMSTCHRIDALVYKSEAPPSEIAAVEKKPIEKKVDNSSLLDLSNNGPAKDRIALKNGRIIEGQVTKLENNKLFLIIDRNGNAIETHVAADEVQKLSLDYQMMTRMLPSSIDYPVYRLAIDYGFGIRTAKIADGINSQLEEIIRKQKSGAFLSVSGGYFFSEGLGLGLDYSLYHANYSKDNVNFIIGDINYNGDISDQLRIYYFGPSMLLRSLSDDRKSGFNSSISFGYIGYNEKLSADNNDLTMKGGTLGMKLTAGYDLALSDHFGLGFQASLTGGNLSQIRFEHGSQSHTEKLPEEQRESLAHLSLGIGLRFF